MDLKLGELITSEQARDAVHVAIAPVIAAVPLKPGEHIRFCPNSIIHVTNQFYPAIGIVDPFLRYPIKTGQQFFMMLYPNTITSLRHEWSHPIFDNFKEVTDSLNFMKEFAQKFGYTYEEFSCLVDDFYVKGDYIYDNSESYKDVDADWVDFWYHYNRYHQLEHMENKIQDGGIFTCSC